MFQFALTPGHTANNVLNIDKFMVFPPLQNTGKIMNIIGARTV